MPDRVVSYVFRGDISGLKASMAAAGQSVGKLADDLTKADAKSAKFRQGLSTVGDTAGKVGLVAAAGIGAIVVATANFDKAMSAVAATGEDAKNNLDALRDAAIEAGAKTAFSASEAAAGIENLAKAGVSAGDVLGGGLSGALDLAAAGEIEVADAAEIAATAMTQFKLTGEQIPHVADLLAAAAGKAQGGVADMSMALKQSGLVAAQMGLSIEETTGTLAAFASAGLLGSDAGTSFRTMLLRLANPTQESADLMAQLGISAYDASGQFVGMASIADQLQVAFQGQTQATRDAALATLFGSDAIRAASILYSEGAEGIAEWEANVNDAGFAAETASTRLDNLAGDLEALKGSLETALIGSGEGSQGMLRGLVQGITDAVNAFNELPPAAKNTTTALLGITAVTGGTLWFGAKVVQGVAHTRQAMDQLGVSSEKAGKAMRGLAVAGGALAAASIGFAAIDALNDALDESLPGMEALTRDLLELANAEIGGSLSAEFDSLADSIGRVADGRWDDDLMRVFDSILPGENVARSLREANAEITALDAALASFVTSAGPDAATDAFIALTEAQNLTEREIYELSKLLPQFDEALTGAGNEALITATSTDEAADGIAGMGDAAADATGEVQALSDSINGLLDPLLEQDAATVAWKRSMRTLTKELKGGADALDVNTKKGQDNRDAIRGRVEDLKRMVAADEAAGVGQQRLTQKLISGAKQILAAGEAANISEGEMREYLRTLGLTPKQIKTLIVAEGVDAAQSEVLTYSQMLASIPRSLQTTITTSHIDKFYRETARASGGYISGPGTGTSDSIPARLSNGEYVIRAAAVDKYGIGTFDALNAMRFAQGGYVNGFADGGSVDDRLNLLRLQQQINELRRDLAAGDKDQIKGLARAIAEAELEAAKRDLRQARRAPFVEQRAGLREQMGALRGIGLDVEGGASVEETREALREFRRDVREAGGEWTKQMAKTAHRLIDLAKASERTENRLERETEKRDRLADKLDEEIRALEQVKQAMESYSASVAGNFLSSVFGLSASAPTGGSPVAAPNPALAGTEAAIADARARLEGIRASGGDPLDRSYRASKVVAELNELERQANDLGRGAASTLEPMEEAKNGLELLRETLIRDTEAARGFAESLQKLKANGLDGGLFQQLAASGDTATAGLLAGLAPKELAELNALWAEREEAAAQVATYATQEVFGAQLEAATRAVEMTERTLARQDKTIERLNTRLENLGERVEAGAERGVASLRSEIQSIRSAIDNLPRATTTEKQKSGAGRRR